MCIYKARGSAYHFARLFTFFIININFSSPVDMEAAENSDGKIIIKLCTLHNVIMTNNINIKINAHR